MKDAAILEAIRNREEHGLSACIDQYAKLLWKTASAVLVPIGSEQDVEECVADVFITFWEHPDAFDPSRGKLKSFLCIVARNRALDRCRQILRHSTVPLEETVLISDLGAEEALLLRENQKEIYTAIHSLNETMQEILVRRYYYDQKQKEIALALNLTVKQVDNSLYRAKRQLKTALSEDKEDIYG